MKDNNIIIKLIHINKITKVHKNFRTKKGTKIKELFDQIKLENILPFFCKAKNKIGIFGKIVSWNYTLKDGDRIEIYENIELDPKNQRRKLVGLRKKDKCS